ncbi:uncharacterized protein [Watersipora subatra]|uniref:uncharacterized protein isoform X3 n=1 Tax=Watersipora subatra TaxID=2589382 RepID=UPI00355B01EF
MAADIFQEIVSQFVIECEKNGYSGVVYLHHVLTKQVIVQCSGEGSGKLAVAQIAAGKRVLVSEEPTLTEPLIPEPNSVCLESTSQPIYPENVEIKAEGVDHSEDNSEKDDSEVFDFDAYIKQHPLAGAVDDTQLQATAGDEDQTGADVHDGTHHLSSSSHAAGDPGTGLSGSDHTNIFTSFSHTEALGSPSDSDNQRVTKDKDCVHRPDASSEIEMKISEALSKRNADQGKDSHLSPLLGNPLPQPVTTSFPKGSPTLVAQNLNLLPFAAPKDFRVMEQLPERPNCCDICNKSFTTKGDLTRHMRVHTGEKPYTCGICKTAFSQSGNLKTHMRLYSREKPYECKECNRSFCGTTNYNKHMKHHLNGKQCACSTCKPQFPSITRVAQLEGLTT